MFSEWTLIRTNKWRIIIMTKSDFHGTFIGKHRKAINGHVNIVIEIKRKPFDRFRVTMSMIVIGT